MAKTSSLNWPSMFNISQNQVSVIEDNKSIVNRTRLLMLTEPKELYNNPNFGVGLKRHLFKYNNDNEKAMLLDRLKNQLRLHEPYVEADQTEYKDGLLFTGQEDSVANIQDYNTMKLTIALKTTYSNVIDVDLVDFGEAQSDYE